ncbi:vacuolar protein sorting-associated protein 33A-like [Pocillopora damicornis]|uniref:vacuolar protein sorting-associated protein 33A-like n=1 Tax=Pocillopora damicornis TaxID=46731 RepID=UPI000F55099E|nr:vacuolar protein sorting-associated protein 33A-like [Pocillopora damicornis]
MLWIEETADYRASFVVCSVFTNNGFKPKMLEFYYREILQTYGFEHTYRTLSTLETAGLLRAQTQPSRSYNQLRKSMKLVVEDVQEQNPNDIAYVFSGYAPLTVRLAQFLARPQGWRGLEEVNRRVIVQISLFLECNMWTIARD